MSVMALRTFSICSTALFLKFSATTIMQGSKAFTAGTRPPEDNELKRSAHPKQNYGRKIAKSDQDKYEDILAAREEEHRWRRIIQNDLESIPIGMGVILGSVLAGGDEMLNCFAMTVFTMARIGHTYSYVKRLQPARSVMWIIGQTAVLLSGVNGLLCIVFFH